MPTALLFCIVPVGALLMLYILLKYIRTGSFGDRLDTKIQLAKDTSSLLLQNWIFLAIVNTLFVFFFHGYIFAFDLVRDFGRIFWVFTPLFATILPLSVVQWLMLRNSFAMRGCLYLGLWITVSFMGFYMAAIFSVSLIRPLDAGRYSGDTAIQARTALILPLLNGALLGFGLGLGQWAMLTLLRACWPWWVMINVLSYMLAGFLLSLWHIPLRW